MTSPVYDFNGMKDIYCFSDLEGNAPEEIKTIIGFNTNGALESDKAIVFTGDLIDRGPLSLRLMKRMLELKTSTQKQVILVGGNRDFNKLRLFEELFICTVDNQLPWNGTAITKIDNLIELCQTISTSMPTGYKFLFGSSYLSELLKDKNPWKSIKDWNGIFSESPERVNNIYDKTMGAGKWAKAFAKEEIIEIFSPNTNNIRILNDAPNVLYTLIAILNMIMGHKWRDEQLPLLFRQDAYKWLNGLYVKYAEQAHIIAAFRKNNIYSIVSHAGLPYKDNEFKLVSPFGSAIAPQDTQQSFMDVVQQLENEKQTMLNEYTPIIESMIINLGSQEVVGPRSNEMFIKFSLLQADVKVVEAQNINSELSPVVSASSLYAKGPYALKKTSFSISLDAPTKGGTTIEANLKESTNNGITFLNIFGHQPCGYTPEISKVDNVNVYHVNLDISKAEDFFDTNTNCYTYLHIHNDGKVKVKGSVYIDLQKQDMFRHIVDSTKIADNAITIQKTKNANNKDVITILNELTGSNVDFLKDSFINSFKYEYDLMTYCSKSISLKNIKPLLDTETRPLYLLGTFEHQVIKQMSRSTNVQYYDKDVYEVYTGMMPEFIKLIYINPIKTTELVNHIGGGSHLRPSSERVKIGNKTRIVYLSKRGAKYIKQKGEYVKLKTAMSQIKALKAIKQ